MGVALKLYTHDRGEFEELREWLAGLAGVAVEPVARPAEPNAQNGTVWDFLSVACGAGGPLVAFVRALQVWLESRVTTVEVALGEKRFTIKSADAASVLPVVAETVKALESGETPHDGAA